MGNLLFILQNEPIFLKLYHTVVPQPAKLVGHCTAVNGEKIRKLLAVEGTGKAAAAVFPCLLGKIGNELFTGGAL